MKILYLHWGGNSGVVNSVGRTLLAQGHEVESVDFGLRLSPKHNPFDRRALAHFLYTYARFRSGWHQAHNATPRAFRLISELAQREIERTRPDAILQSGGRFGIDPGDLPYVIYIDHTRTISERYPAIAGVPAPRRFGDNWIALENGAFQRATAIRTFSRHAAESFFADYGIPESKVEAIGAGPNLGELPGLEERSMSGEVVLAVGVVKATKGFDTLEAAYPAVRAAHPRARFEFVGVDGPNRDGIAYRGRLPSARMGDVYREADVYALPTIREAFGISYVEAMAYGLPCIGSDIEAIPEIIDDGKTGFVVPPLDAAAWAERINWLLANPEHARSMGRAGRERVETFFNWDTVCAKLAAALAGG